MRYLILTLFIYLFFNLISGYTSTNPTFYLSSQSLCKSECGSEDQPFSNFKEAIDALSALKLDSTIVLIVDQGEYTGQNNQEIKIDFNLEIRSKDLNFNTIVDCQTISYAFKVTGSSTLLIKGLVIKNCVAYRGGAIFTENRETTLESTIFISNSAKIGSAIYSTAEILEIKSCSFLTNVGISSIIDINNSLVKISNSRFVNNVGGKDIKCGPTTTTISSIDSYFSSSCTGTCVITDQNNLGSLCNKGATSVGDCNLDGVCDLVIETNDNCPHDCPAGPQLCNNNGVCEPTIGENYKNCLTDCNADLVPGWKFEQFDYEIAKPKQTFTKYNSPIDIDFLTIPSIRIEYSNTAKAKTFVSGKLSSKLSITETRDYYFKLQTLNLATIVYIDGRVLFDNFFKTDQHENQMTFERKLLLSKEKPHMIEVYFTAAANDFQRELDLFWRTSSQEEYSLVPSSFISLIEKIECGDGICNEEPSTCLIDCHDQFEPNCSPTSPPPPLQDYYKPIQDTIGTLLNTQYLSTLPGLKYMSQGIDLVTGKSRPTSIFAHTYCDDTSFSLAHFHYRDSVYTIPQGLNAQISPQCTSDAKNRVYSSAESFSRKEADGWGISSNVNGNNKIVSVSTSYSQSGNTKKAVETKKLMDGSLYESSVLCKMYKVNMVEPYRWNPVFIQDIANAYHEDENIDIAKTKTINNMVQVINNYGYGYYKSATLGGRLDQYTVINNTFASRRTSNEIDNNHSYALSVSVSAGIYKAKAKHSGSIDQSTTKEEFDEYIKNSKRSTLIVSGGAPGSYGQDEPNAFESWTNSLDKLPVPIEGSIGYVSDILPSNWYFKGNLNVKDLWEDAERIIFKDILKVAKLKYTDTNDASIDYLISNLGKTQNLYALVGLNDNFDCVFDFNLKSIKVNIETQASSSVVTQSALIATPAHFGFTLFGIDLNDEIGLRSIQFTNVNGADIKPQACSKFKFISTSTTRQYHMEFETSTSKFVTQKPIENELSLQFTDLLTIHNCQPEGKCGVRFNIIGSHSTVYRQMGFGVNTIPPLKTTEYIGEIVGISLSFIGVPFNVTDPSMSIANYTVSFKSMIISQACPDDPQSDCIPNQVSIDNRIGYTKTYESWKLPVRTTRDHFVFTANHTSNPFVTIDPFGV